MTKLWLDEVSYHLGDIITFGSKAYIVTDRGPRTVTGNRKARRGAIAEANKKGMVKKYVDKLKPTP